MADSAMLTCRACGHSGSFRTFSAREMLHGTRHRFDYGECPGCGSLQIGRIPANLPEYYPSDYYSLQPPPARSKKARFLRRAWARWLIASPSGFAEGRAKKMARKYPFFYWMRLCGGSLDAPILDVGCGTGGLLRRMQRYGFSNLTGVDPYAPSEVSEAGFSIRKTGIEAVSGAYQVIMMHHVLEHLEDPKKALEDAKSRLAPGGRILIRVPVAGSLTHRLYQEHWFNLDPPRHLLVPSPKGMEALAVRSGQRILFTGFDGIETGFLNSEAYQQDVPYCSKPADSSDRKRHFRKLAEAANRRGEGDQGIFVLGS